jgi:hypothetical protein
MARSDNKDPKLSEVKAVLQRLQGFETEPEPAAKTGPETERRSGRGGTVVTGTIVLAAIIGLLGAAYIFVRAKAPAPDQPTVAEVPTARTPSVPQPPPVASEPAATPGPQTPGPQRLDPPTPDPKAALEGARALMAKGKVRAAREQLLALAGKGSPDAAWDLARSYDPNVLAGLPADATPDVKEATRWYRAWYAAAVRDGLVADSISLERIIGSMRQ